MSKFLQRLFKEVLDKFPFSISGYRYPEKEYEEFFHGICKFQESLDEDNKIHFTISGFAKLKISSSLSETELDEWKTESLKSFLFNDNYLGYSEPILSLYILLLERLSPGKRVVNILAENFLNSVLVKVSLSGKFKKIHFSFLKSDNTLLIEVPTCYFLGSGDGKKDSFEEFFKNINYGDDLIVIRDGDTSSYSIKQFADDKKNKFAAAFDKMFDLSQIKMAADSIPENIYDNLLKKVLKNDTYKSKDIFSLVFASAILCYFYDCSLTYFVSTARVVNDKRYTLGAIGIGVKTGFELSDNDQALYSILVNHLASNLSTQIIFESNKHLKREADKVRLREALNKLKNLNGHTDILHGETPTNETFEANFNTVYQEYSDLLTDFFLIAYDKLKTTNCSHISKYCLVQLMNSGDCGKCKINERPKLFKSSNGLKCCSSIGTMSLINIPLIEALFDRLTTEDKGNIAAVDKALINDKNEISFDISYSKGFSINQFIGQLKISHPGTLIGSFFIDNFQALDCHGIFKMIAINEGSEAEFFNSRNTIQEVNLKEKKIIINESYQFPNIDNTKNIKIVFKNEL